MAKLKKPVNTITALEKEIYRLRLEARRLQDRLEDQADHLRQNFGGMTYNSIFHRTYQSGTEMLGAKLTERIWNNEKLQDGLGKIMDHFLDKAAESIERFADKVKEKKENDS
ncbi:MAG TPA: hypothetical protein PKE63_12775 [Lacibacter sp.]|nr:hypothetical protein [Lacibacter sp.]HMO90050.1 hypothetical protein [Lacibacter sp.]HMP88146.1 hypothetical protein [Lacibacter sp.]